MRRCDHTALCDAATGEASKIIETKRMKTTKQGLRMALAALVAAHLGWAAAEGIPQ